MYITLLIQSVDTIANAERYVNPNDGSAMHTMLTWLQHSTRENNHLLYRVIKKTNVYLVYVQSDTPLNTNNIAQYGFAVCGTTQLTFTVNRQVKFNMKVHPTYTVDTKPKFLKNPEQRITWYNKKLADSGLQVHAIQEVASSLVEFSKSANKVTRIACCDVVGVATIKDPEKFRHFVQHGVGKLKNYGAGLFLFN